MDKDDFLKALQEAAKTAKFNPDLEHVGFTTSKNPTWFWQPNKDKNVRCDTCGNPATHQAKTLINTIATSKCNDCMWTSDAGKSKQ